MASPTVDEPVDAAIMAVASVIRKHVISGMM
jgi:hypothetical protein